MKKFWCVVPLVIAIVGIFCQSAFARKEYQDQFKEQHYKPKSTDPAEKKLADAIDKISKKNPAGAMESCSICHMPDKVKKERNSYGKELAKHLKKADIGDTKKIKAVLEKVAGEKSPGGPTFGDLIKKGELPGSEDKKEEKKEEKK